MSNWAALIVLHLAQPHSAWWMQIVSEIPYPVHWLTHEVAMAPALHPEAEAAEHAMPLNLRFRCPPHRRWAPRPTPASTMVPHPAWSWTPPRSRQPEAPVRRPLLPRYASSRASWQNVSTDTPSGGCPPHHSHTPLLPRNLTPAGGHRGTASHPSNITAPRTCASTAAPRRTLGHRGGRPLAAPTARAEAAVIGADAGGRGCLDGAPSVYSRPFSPSWPRRWALGSLAGGLAAGHGDQGVSQLPSGGGWYFEANGAASSLSCRPTALPHRPSASGELPSIACTSQCWSNPAWKSRLLPGKLDALCSIFPPQILLSFCSVGCCRHGKLEQDMHWGRCKSLRFGGHSKLRITEPFPSSPLQFVNLRPDKHGMEITPEKLQIHKQTTTKIICNNISIF